MKASVLALLACLVVATNLFTESGAFSATILSGRKREFDKKVRVVSHVSTPKTRSTMNDSVVSRGSNQEVRLCSLHINKLPIHPLEMTSKRKNSRP